MDQQGKKRSGLGKVFLIFACLLIAGFVVTVINTFFGPTSEFHIRRHPEEFETLDYAAVALRPEWYYGKRMHLDGVFLGYIQSAPNSDSDFLFLKIGERENTNRVWIAKAFLARSDVEKLTNGMDVSIYGKCYGTMTYQTLFDDRDLPAVFVYLLDYGYKFSSEVTP